MARVTYVKKAQQRYETVPVLDEDGKQKTVPVLRRDGTPKVTKTGRAITRRLTVEDKSKPKPNRKCEKCGQEIKVGDPYKWVAPKSGPYGGYKRYRCGPCPSWKPSELSSSKMATIMAAQEDFDVSGAETISDINEALNDFAQTVREVAQEYRDSSENIEQGFGTRTYMVDELEQKADDLESWADDLESGIDGDDDDWERCPLHSGHDIPGGSNDDHIEEDACDDCHTSREDFLDERRSEAEDKINETPF